MKLKHLARRCIRSFGYDLKRIQIDESGMWYNANPAETPYVERDEYGPSNIETKISIVESGGEFESFDIVNLNLAVASRVGADNRIAELGAGTGKFACKVAEDPRRSVVASEFDTKTHQWTLENRRSPNIQYVNGPIPSEMGSFDLAVAIELIEHVDDFVALIREMGRLAPRALITTPNRAESRRRFTLGPPDYYKHVREWTGGEFYWVMRSFFREVELFGLISVHGPDLVKTHVNTSLPYVIADCRNPY